MFCISVRFLYHMLVGIRILVTMTLLFQTINLEIYIIWLLWVNLIFNRVTHVMFRILDSILNPYLIVNVIFHKIFWHLKVTQSFLCFWINQVSMYLSQCNIFVSSPRWIFVSSLVGFVVSLVENLLIDLTPKNVWKFSIFPGELSGLHQGTETGCSRGGGTLIWYPLKRIFLQNSKKPFWIWWT